MFAGEIIDQLVLACPDREALANSAVQFVAETGLVAGQSFDDRGKRTEPAGELSGAKSDAHKNERRRRPNDPAHQARSESGKLFVAATFISATTGTNSPPIAR
jgi:hypothetical protein